MAIAAYSKTCAKNTAGNYHKVFFNTVDQVKTCTLTSGEISAFGIDSAKFENYVGEIDSVQYKVEGQGGQNYFTTQTLIMKFAKKSKALLAAIENLVSVIACGVVAIHVDGNGIAWLDGYDGQSGSVDPTARPFNKMKVTFDSGLKPSDADMNAVTIELTRESEWENIPFDSTLSAAILGGTGTSYINYT